MTPIHDWSTIAGVSATESIRHIMSHSARYGPQPARGRVHWADPHSGPKATATRALSLLKADGISGLTLGILRFGSALLHTLYSDELLFAYELPLDRAGPLPWEPPVEGCDCHVIEDDAAADRLAMQGYDDFRIAIPPARKRLERGAVPVCAYIDRAFASIDWMAFSKDAQHSVSGVPFHVRYEDHHAFTGGALTSPAFRNLGIATYRLSHQLRYMRDRGITVCCNAIEVGNLASQRCVEKHGARVRSLCRYRKVFGWKSWTERPVESDQ